MPHFREDKFSCGLYSKRLKRILLRMNPLEVKCTTILLFERENKFSLMQLLPEIFQLIIQLIPFQLKEIISIIKYNNHHFILNLTNFNFSIIVKFSNLIKLVPKNIPILNAIKIDIKVQLKDSSLN